MASLTTHLKLRLADTLTDDALFNLERIDELGGTFNTNLDDDALLRSKNNISILPESPDIGGSGTGGTINLGSSSQAFERLEVYGGVVDFNSSTVENFKLPANDSFYTELKAAQSGQSANLQLVFPNSSGSSNQVLSTDGSGNLSWATIPGLGTGAELTDTWITAEGSSKTITHSLGTRNIMVQVLDASSNYQTIDVCVERPNDNQIELTSAEAPLSSWTILLKEIGN